MTEKKFYGMHNDYMFKAVLQKSEEVLRNLISALLGIHEEDIFSCKIENPIELGKSVDSKECILDVKLTLNNSKIINIELQMRNEFDWPERSLLYWSKSFDSIKSGENYLDLKPTYQIGIIDFKLFPDHPEFYAEYLLMNRKTHYVYSDKMSIRVLDLTSIDLAVPEDEKLVKWAKIFKAKTMEELEQIIGNERSMKQMTSTIRQLSEEEKIQQQCAAREDYERRLRTQHKVGELQGIEIGKEIGKKMGEESGAKRANLATAAALKKEGVDISIIAKCTTLTLEEIEKL